MHRDSPAAPPRWVTPAGIATFVALMSAGYAYDVTFVQLGATDLSLRGSAAGVAFERHVASVSGVTIPALVILLLIIVWPRPRGATG